MSDRLKSRAACVQVRPRDNPWQWVLPAEQRDQAAAALVAHMRSQRQQQQLQMRVPQGHEARPRNATLANGRSSQVFSASHL